LLSARVAVKQLNKVSVLNRSPVEMDGFGSDFSAGGSGGKIDTGTIMEQVKVQIAVANAQELLQVAEGTSPHVKKTRKTLYLLPFIGSLLLRMRTSPVRRWRSPCGCITSAAQHTPLS
ncbi:hypothetical protein GOODEAATRI_002440, partial [Goodea atripinnis]